MPEIIPYHLNLINGFRVGTRGVNLEEASPSIPSDSLFSALVDCVSRLGQNATHFVEQFNRNPPFLLTSVFPRVGNIRLYPMPMGLLSQFNPNDRETHGKALKKIKFISEGVLLRLLNGDAPSTFLFPKADVLPTVGAALQQGEIWILLNETTHMPKALQLTGEKRIALFKQQIWQRDVVPRVTVSRETQQSQIFHTGRTTFAAGCGLWFGLQLKKTEAKMQVDQLMSMLQHDGLGGERGSGYGAFTFEPKPVLRLPDPKLHKLGLLLSRYHPNADELAEALGAKSAYTLVPVGGWLRSIAGGSQRRKQVMMIESGSVVSIANASIGNLANVTPTFDNKQGELSHQVYRNGHALAIDWSAFTATDAKNEPVRKQK